MKTREEYINELTNNREFKLTSGEWVSGGIDHYTLNMLKELYKVSRVKKMEINEKHYIKKIGDGTAVEVECVEFEFRQNEKQMLWAILNNAQAQGLMNLYKLKELTEKPMTLELYRDWVKQTKDEYDFIDRLKSQLDKSVF
jgi:hypothetical protein